MNQIERNLKNVKEGKPLDVPLALLNERFKKRYFTCIDCGKRISDGNMFGYCKSCFDNPPRRKEYDTNYRNENKVKLKIWSKRNYQKNKGKYRKYVRDRARKKLKIPKSRWRVK